MNTTAEKTINDLLYTAADAWESAVEICPDRDKETEQENPGQGKLCKNPENTSSMGWCE